MGLRESYGCKFCWLQVQARGTLKVAAFSLPDTCSILSMTQQKTMQVISPRNLHADASVMCAGLAQRCREYFPCRQAILGPFWVESCTLGTPKICRLCSPQSQKLAAHPCTYALNAFFANIPVVFYTQYEGSHPASHSASCGSAHLRRTGHTSAFHCHECTFKSYGKVQLQDLAHCSISHVQVVRKEVSTGQSRDRPA